MLIDRNPEFCLEGVSSWTGGLNPVLTLFIRLQVSKLIVLDPPKRLSVREALQHPWVLGKAARFSHMDTAQRKLQEFNARRKLKVRTASRRRPMSLLVCGLHTDC